MLCIILLHKVFPGIFQVIISNGTVYQERRRHINLRKIPGTPAGCSWDTRRDKQGSTGRCPRNLLLFAIEKRTEKGIFAGTPAGCPRDTRPCRGFSEIFCDFFLCAFSAPYYSKLPAFPETPFPREGAQNVLSPRGGCKSYLEFPSERPKT